MVPCPGLNEHPIARMKTLIMQFKLKLQPRSTNLDGSQHRFIVLNGRLLRNNEKTSEKIIDKYIKLVLKTVDPDDEVEIYYDFEEGMQKVNIKVLDRVLN